MRICSIRDVFTPRRTNVILHRIRTQETFFMWNVYKGECYVTITTSVPEWPVMLVTNRHLDVCSVEDIVIKRDYDDLKNLWLVIIASAGNLFVFLSGDFLHENDWTVVQQQSKQAFQMRSSRICGPHVQTSQLFMSFGSSVLCWILVAEVRAINS